VSPRAATALPLLLIAACAAAFLRTEQLKLRHSPVGNPHVRQAFSPGCSDPHCRPVARMRFTLRSPQVLTLAMVDAHGTPVATLVSRRRYPKTVVHVPWDGTTSAGGRAPDGTYELRVTLTSGRRLTIPDPVVVDTVPPTVTIGAVQHGRTQLNIPYRRSPGPGKALLVVTAGDGSVVLHRRVIAHECHLRYDQLTPGRYTVSIVAVDQAGNRTPDPPSFRVTIP
jgi:hypothetical protein